MTNLVSIEKLYSVIALSVLLVALFMQLSVAYAEEEITVDTKEVLVFLKDVFQVDVEKYEVTLVTSGTEYWPELGGIAQTTGEYMLDSTGQGGTSLLTVIFTFWDEELIGCRLYEESQGPTLYSEQAEGDLIGAASGFLQRYKTRTKDEQLTQMSSLMDTVEVVSNITKTIDTLSLSIAVDDYRTSFTWSNTISETALDGAGYSRLNLGFQSGHLSDFKDDRNFYTLGSSEVNISQEEAVNIALKGVENYSYMFDGEEITDFNVSSNLILSRPHFLNKTSDPMELYPCWRIELGLDTYYPGGVASIEVWLWADSGDAFLYQAKSYGGFMPDPSTTPSTDSTKSDNSGTVPPAVYIAVACVAFAVPIAVVAIAIKRRKK